MSNCGCATKHKYCTVFYSLAHNLLLLTRCKLTVFFFFFHSLSSPSSCFRSGSVSADWVEIYSFVKNLTDRFVRLVQSCTKLFFCWGFFQAEIDVKKTVDYWSREFNIQVLASFFNIVEESHKAGRTVWQKKSFLKPLSTFHKCPFICTFILKNVFDSRSHTIIRRTSHWFQSPPISYFPPN